MYKQLNSKFRKQINEKLKSSKAIQDLFNKHKVDLEVVDFVPMCFADNLDVSARTMHGIIYFNSKLKNSDDIFHYAAHEITHTIEQCFGDGPTEGSTDDDYLDNIHEQHGFQTQTRFISETESPEKAEAYVEKVLEHHDIPESEKEEKKEDLLRTAGLFQNIKNKFLNKKDSFEPLRCVACQRSFGSEKDHDSLYPLKSTLKIRGKDVCVDCYGKMIEYRKGIHCTCGHSYDKHGLKEGERSFPKYECKDQIYLYRTNKKCPCENYKPSVDDYSDASDGKQLSLKFEKRDKSKPRKENIQELKDRIMHEIETGEKLKRKEEYRERPSKKLSPKEHPYANKSIADLARKVMKATEKKDDNSTDDKYEDYTSCDRCSSLILYPHEYMNKNLCDTCYRPIAGCEICGHSVGDHRGGLGVNKWKLKNFLGKGHCIVLLDTGYRSTPKQCSCEHYV